MRKKYREEEDIMEICSDHLRDEEYQNTDRIGLCKMDDDFVNQKGT